MEPTTLQRQDILDTLTAGGWQIEKIRSFLMLKGEYCLPTRQWMERDLSRLWFAEAERLGLQMNSPKYNCVDIALENRQWIVRSDAVNPAVPCARLWGMVLFRQRVAGDHAINWTVVNDGGPEPAQYDLHMLYFDAQLGLYTPDKNEILSNYSALA